jgi:CBS domain-containing protein
MPLNFTIIESFLSVYEAAIKSTALPGDERRRILLELRDKLDQSLDEYDEFQSRFLSFAGDEIEKAGNYDELDRFHREAVKQVGEYFLKEDSVIDAHNLLRIVRDSITVKVLRFVEEEMESDGYGFPPSRYVWIALGSEGRDEQTMVTDQDNMIIFGAAQEGPGGAINDYLVEKCYEHQKSTGMEADFEKIVLTEEIIIDYYYKVFSEKIVERLHQTGFERCTGEVMPSNPRWRGTITTWKEKLEERFIYRRGIFRPLDMAIMTDARCITGDRQMFDELLEYFFGRLKNHVNVMREFIEAAVLIPTALGFFGKIQVEKSGEYKDMVNLKLFGWAPLILAVRILALSNGIYEQNTLSRIRLLQTKNAIKKDMEKDLTDAYLVFVKFRMMNQMILKDSKNHMDLNYLKPDMLGPHEEERLRKAMKTVETLQKHIHSILLYGETL